MDDSEGPTQQDRGLEEFDTVNNEKHKFHG